MTRESPTATDARERRRVTAPFVVAGILCLAFLAGRAVNLDYDGPLYAETQYNSWLDTFVYSLRAINWYNWNYYDERYWEIIGQNIPALYISNVITYVSLLIFGDNFYGYRLGAVAVSLAGAVFLGLVLYRNHGWPAALVAVLYLLVDYNFFVASREVEPTTFRMFELALSLYLFALIIKPGQFIPAAKIVLLSFLSFALVLLEYPTSLFVPAAMVATLAVFRTRSIEDLCSVVGAAILGLVFALCLYLAVVWLSGDSLAVLGGMSGIWGPRVTASGSFSVTAIRNLNSIPKALFFTYVPFLWEVFVATLCYFTLRTTGVRLARTSFFARNLPRRGIVGAAARPANPVDVFIVFLIIFLLLQSIFINDFPVRKQVIWLPIFVYCLAVAVADVVSLVATRHRLIRAAITLTPVAYLAAYSMPKIVDKAILTPTFMHKEAMLSLKDYDRQYFIGFYSLGFTLYNDILPVGNPYMYNRPEYPIEFRQPVLDLIEGTVPDAPNLTIYRGDRELGQFGFERGRLVLAPRERVYHPLLLWERR